ncbi:MAG: DUF2589 domain-containing protein [Lachnospiraceae bacterium]|nr:DUF2589 domain-containing protein [Lachnospiraceae bacterium]
MPASEEYNGLDMHNLICGPLLAAAEASKTMGDSIADFLQNAGLDENGGKTNIPFVCERRKVNEDGMCSSEQITIDVPLLSILPIPMIQIDEANNNFNME